MLTRLRFMCVELVATEQRYSVTGGVYLARFSLVILLVRMCAHLRNMRMSVPVEI